MTELHFRLNIEDIHILIIAEVKNNMLRTILTNLFNELMKKERYWVLSKWSVKYPNLKKMLEGKYNLIVSGELGRQNL